MTKFLLGVAVGYVFHNTIDKAVQLTGTAFEKQVSTMDVVNETEVTP
jgi:hypothetical protein